MSDQSKIAGALRAELRGDVVAPGDSGWDDARQAWNLTADQNPAAVAFAASADDVASTVRIARDAGLGVAAQGTGHGAAPMAPLDEVVLLKTERMNGVEVDADARTARVEAGTQWLALLEVCDPAGLAGLAGSSPDVGVVGYSLGGGLGWLGRCHGFSCNSVTGFDVVTADGEARRVDADSEPDLFWAMRGGGGNFGIVTAMDIALVPASQIYAGSVVLPAEGARDILQAYREWAAGVPEELTTVARFLHLPPIPEVPEPLRDRPVVTIGACYLGPEDEGAELVAPMRGLAEPIMDLFTAMPASGLVRVAMDPEEPVPGLVHGALVRDLDERAVDAFVDVAGPESGSPLLQAELRQLGGALSRPAENAGALSHLDAGFVFNGVGMPMAPGMAEAITAHLDKVNEALGDWLAKGAYLNFVERPTAFDDLFSSEVGQRLSEVKREWDPDNVIRANHAVPAAA
jgi:FAD binding domain/Berberine and berberine like